MSTKMKLNNTIRTPSDLAFLLHCHVSPSPHPHASSPAIVDGISRLLAHGLIQREDRHFGTTEKGKFYIEHLLSTPFPVESFSIPERE